MSRSDVNSSCWFPPAGTLSAATPSVWESPSRRDPTTAWSDTSATCWATAAPGWRSESRACTKTWPGTPTGQRVGVEQRRWEGRRDEIRAGLMTDRWTFRLYNLTLHFCMFLPEATRCALCASPSTCRRTPASKWSLTWCQTCRTWAWRETWSSSS